MPDNNQCTHSGGIVFRLRGDSVEYLLIGPSKERPGEWLLPKGHIECEENCRDAAVREVEEETGVVARIIEPLSVSEVQLTFKKITVRYYLMEMLDEHPPQEKRRIGWFPFEEAVKLISHDANRLLLMEAEQMRVLLKK
jgi:ADP-ribose pyrophosphatase YjhB (NUDIX family)